MKFDQSRLRLTLLGAIMAVVFLLFILRLTQVQIVEGEQYLARQQRVNTRTQVIKAARGEILDRYGRPFSNNRACYNLVFDRTLTPTAADNETILKLINILRARNERWVRDLPLRMVNGNIVLSDDTAGADKLRAHLNTNIYTGAEDLFFQLCERYDLHDYERADALAIAGVRYEMERKGYSISVRYTFAEDVSLETAVLVRQQNASLPGVEVEETSKRSYVDGDLAPHIIGRIGPIFADELDNYLSQDRGYSRDDIVGTAGIERVYESVLRGVDGERSINLDASYRFLDVTVTKPARPGNSVVLTIDKDIQRVAMQALIDEIKLLNETAPEGQGREADAGAVVAVDIKSSEVLAAVSFPGYDLSSFAQDYSRIANDPLVPLLNRAFSGVYAPGSCFKPTTGTAGLNEGIITPESVVVCQQVYTYLPTYQPTCLRYHGGYTVTDALRASCNIFFYDTGRQVGIRKLNEYAQALGLGVPTGIELPEAVGTQCDPDNAYPGDVLQAAIGQLDNGYTPIQLANYCATIARRGVRMDLSLVKSISSYYDWEETLAVHEPQVANVLETEDFVFDTIHEGMHQASQILGGTAYRYFYDFPYTVASKTGTPQTAEFPNSTFICFAPIEDPQIAVAVVIEKGWHGYTGAPVARAVLDAYFFPPEDKDEGSGNRSFTVPSQAEPITSTAPNAGTASSSTAPQEEPSQAASSSQPASPSQPSSSQAPASSGPPTRPGGGYGASVAPSANSSGGYGASEASSASSGGYGASEAPSASSGGYGASVAPSAGSGGYGASVAPSAGSGGYGASVAPSAGSGGYGASVTPSAGSGGYGASQTTRSNYNDLIQVTPNEQGSGYGASVVTRN